MKTTHMATFGLMALGALNWGLIALFNFDLVNVIFGSWPSIERLVFILVGASAVYEVSTHAKTCKLCGKK